MGQVNTGSCGIGWALVMTFPCTPAVLYALPTALTSPLTMVASLKLMSMLLARSPFDPAVAGLYGATRES